MKLIEDFTKDEYIDWLIAYKGYSYTDAVKTADLMGVNDPQSATDKEDKQ